MGQTCCSSTSSTTRLAKSESSSLERGAAEFLTIDEKVLIAKSWNDLLQTDPEFDAIVQNMITAQSSIMRFALTATNQLMFGTLEVKLRRQVKEHAAFVSSLIIGLELKQNDVCLACEQYGSEDAENEIRDETASCAIREVSMFMGMLMSCLASRPTNDDSEAMIDSWRQLTAYMLHAMKDGAYWAEERWGVHLNSHMA